MGKRGPAPMPTKLKVLHGERRKTRLNRSEPEPKAKLPTMPTGMSDAAQAVWKHVVADFGHTGVITAVDGEALRAYCDAVARYQHAAEMLDKSGPLVRGARHGDLVKNPLHQVMRDNADLMRQFARELGLTPSARTNLHVGGKDDDADPLARWEASS